jgi:hypothetical protein
MASTVPRARRAARPRRTVGDVLIGLAAICVLAALTLAVPAVLIRVFGSPIPHTMPGMSALTHRLDVFAVLKILSVVVWLAWLQLVFCVFAEVRAAVRNTGMPARVPLAGGMQSVVHRLVTAALLAFSVATAISPAFTHSTPHHAHSVSALPTPGPAAASGTADSGSPPAGPPGGAHGNGSQAPGAHSPRTEKVYVVQPPVGRFHESLWEIAQKHLGDGRRYREIFELNSGRVQADGTKLTIASLIRPGWILRMPHDAHGPGIQEVRLTSNPSQLSHEAAERPAAATGHGLRGHMASGEAAHLRSPTESQPVNAGGASQPVNAGGASQPAPAHRAPAQQAPAQGPVLPYELAAASLLAAGVLSALGRRRRMQLWRRAFGKRVPVPPPRAAAAEAALRLGASEPAARMLDVGLRYLSQQLTKQGKPLPTVFAAHIGRDNLDLWVAPGGRDAPAPWVAVGDGQVWRLPVTAVPELDAGLLARAAAPYPGMVSIGTDMTGRVLVDLDSAHGLIAVTGPDAAVRAALAAMAVELATNRWSGEIHITLVGFGSDLVALDNRRVRTARSLDEALPELEERARLVEESLGATGAGLVLTGRAPGQHPQGLVPHYLISAKPPTAAERDRLLALARTRHAAASGYVIAGEVAGATWTWQVTGSGRLHAGLLGFDVQAQLLPTEQHAAIVDLFHAAADESGTELGAPLDVAPAEHLAVGAVMPVEVSTLGPVAVSAPGVIEPDRLSLATELVVYLAAHPGGVHPNVLAGAIWPRGASPEVRDAMLARVQEWLGSDGIGRPHLATDASGRLRLGSQVRVDWQVFSALVARAGESARAGEEDPFTGGLPDGHEAALLEQALSLVRGPFLDGAEPGRYAWLASDGLEYEAEARVADAAHRLCELRLATGDAEGAMVAARTGLKLAFDDELLWRDLLIAAHATGDERVLRSVVDEVCARTALDDVLPRMAPQTEALIDELLPSWRSSVA